MKKADKIFLAIPLLFLALCAPVFIGAQDEDFVIETDIKETTAQQEEPAAAQATAVPAEAAPEAAQAEVEPAAEATATPTQEAAAQEEQVVVEKDADTEGIIIISPGEMDADELEKYILPGQRTVRDAGEETAGEKIAEGEEVEKSYSSEDGEEYGGEGTAAARDEGAVVFEAAETDESALMIVEGEGEGKIERAGYVLVESAGFISDNFKEDGTLFSKKSKKILLQTDDVYIRLSVGKGVKPGREFLIYNDDEEVYNPMNDEYLGRFVDVVGYCKVVKKVKDDLYLAKIIRSYGLVMQNYKVKMRNELKQYHNKMTAKPVKKPADVQGFLIRVKGKSITISNRNIVFVDRGLKEGVMPGMKLDVFRQTENNETGEPEDFHNVGRITVINSMKNVSVGLITSQSELFKIGDIVKTYKK
jgi:hypothetical protein